MNEFNSIYQTQDVNQIFYDKFGINLHNYNHLDNEVKEMIMIHYWRTIDEKCKNAKKLVLKPKRR